MSSHNTERFLDHLCQTLKENDVKKSVVDIKYLDIDNAMAHRIGESLKNNTVVTSIALRLSGLHHRNDTDLQALKELLEFLQNAVQLKELTFHGAFFSETANPTIVEMFVQAVARNQSIQKVTLERIHCLTVHGCMRELLASSSKKEHHTSCNLKHLEMLSCNFVIPGDRENMTTLAREKQQIELAKIFISNTSLEYFHASSIQDTWLVPILMHLPVCVQHLHITSGTAITSTALRHLFRKNQGSRLQHLHLSKWTFLANNPFDLIADGLSYGSSVQKLSLEACCLDDASTKAFENLFINDRKKGQNSQNKLKSLCVGNSMKFGPNSNANVLCRLLSNVNSNLLELDIEYMTLGIQQWKEFCASLVNEKCRLQYLSCGYILGDERCQVLLQALPLAQRSLQRIQMDFFPSVAHFKNDILTAFESNCSLHSIVIPHAPFLDLQDKEKLQLITERNRFFEMSTRCPDQVAHSSFWPHVWNRANQCQAHSKDLIYESLMSVMGSSHASIFKNHA